MPDLGPSAAYGMDASLGWTDPNRNLGEQAQNALLGQAWDANNMAMQVQASPSAGGGLARQPAPPALPSHAPTIAPRQFGSDPRMAALRPSDLIEDRRPTALLMQQNRGR
jgi:hypothetical protein